LCVCVCVCVCLCVVCVVCVCVSTFQLLNQIMIFMKFQYLCTGRLAKLVAFF